MVNDTGVPAAETVLNRLLEGGKKSQMSGSLDRLSVALGPAVGIEDAVAETLREAVEAAIPNTEDRIGLSGAIQKAASAIGLGQQL